MTGEDEDVQTWAFSPEVIDSEEHIEVEFSIPFLDDLDAEEVTQDFELCFMRWKNDYDEDDETFYPDMGGDVSANRAIEFWIESI